MFQETSQVKEFFKNQTIFITGGSGFLGKILIEKLLRECEDLNKIYVLLRSKKDKTPEERFQDLFNYACFEKLKSKNREVFKKVFLINGDCQQPLLGLSEQDVNILTDETTCVIHAAANVKFDQSLKEAAYNVRATRDLLEMAKKMSKLRVFVYISTAYSNCLNPHIKEDFYEPPLEPEKLFSFVNSLNDDALQALTPKLLKKWPNTYVFTKCISENLIQTAGQDLPITMVRPAIVVSAAVEPIPGWIDNFYGVIGMITAAALGVIRSLNIKPDGLANIVPVDFVSNCILAAAWKRENSSNTTIYNYANHKDDHLTWRILMRKIEPYCWAAASEKVIWYYCITLRENKTWHNICIFFLHTVPAYLVDGILFCLGKPTIAVQSYKRINNMLEKLSYFSTGTWIFDHDNVAQLWKDMNSEDQKLFIFDMNKIDWECWGYHTCMGGRRHLLKDTPGTFEKGKRKLRILFFSHYAVIAALYYLLYKLVMLIYGIFFSG